MYGTVNGVARIYLDNPKRAKEWPIIRLRHDSLASAQRLIQPHLTGHSRTVVHEPRQEKAAPHIIATNWTHRTATHHLLGQRRLYTYLITCIVTTFCNRY